MTEIKPTLKKESKKEKNKATYIIEPLLPGYGTTMANSLRRILLSSLPGAAITAIKVKGAPHEFSTLPDVKEDMINVVLNLKSIRFEVLTKDAERDFKLELKKKGSGKVKASDIKLPSDIKIANPDQYILTVDGPKGDVDMEITVTQGIGYVPTEAREEEKLPVGTIAVDALYNPVKKVSFEVENTRVGKMTNLDKLTLDIETDGTMDIDDALDYASSVLVDHFSLLKKPEVKEKKEKPAEKKVEKPAKKAASKEASLDPKGREPKKEEKKPAKKETKKK